MPSRFRPLQARRRSSVGGLELERPEPAQDLEVLEHLLTEKRPLPEPGAGVGPGRVVVEGSRDGGERANELDIELSAREHLIEAGLGLELPHLHRVLDDRYRYHRVGARPPIR